MVEIVKTLRNACWFLGGQSKDFVKISLFSNIKMCTRASVELIRDLCDLRRPPRCS